MLKRRSTWRTLPSKMKKMRYTIYTLNSSIFKIPVYLRAVDCDLYLCLRGERTFNYIQRRQRPPILLYILILIYLLLPLLGEALPESRVARELGCVL